MIVSLIAKIAWLFYSAERRADIIIESAKSHRGTLPLDSIDAATARALSRRGDHNAERRSPNMWCIYGGQKSNDGRYEWAVWVMVKK
jgi:hypothetical protein